MRRCIDGRGITGIQNSACLGSIDDTGVLCLHIRHYCSWYARTTHPTVKRTEANAFVDQCEKVKDGRSSGDELEKRQWDEMKRIVEWVLEHEQ